MPYIDTSVLLAAYCTEALSAAANAALEADRYRMISQLVVVEFSSALAIKLRTDQITRPEADQVLAEFDRHLGQGVYDVVPLERHHLDQARKWLSSFQTPLRTLDAIHLAIAREAGIGLLTADQRFADSATACGVACQLLRA